MPLKIIIADVNRLVRDTLVKLSHSLGLRVTGLAANSNEAMWMIRKKRPDILLLAFDLPGSGTFDMLKNVEEGNLQVKTIVHSTPGDDVIIAQCYKAGAATVLLSDAKPTKIATAIKRVIKDGYYFDQTTNMALNRITVLTLGKTVARPDKIDLKENESKVLFLISQELNTRQIGLELHIGLRTVDEIRTTLRNKFGAKNNAGLMVRAMYYGNLAL
jgi:DNA-binding NarL/FixJ family response regulator